MSQGAEFEPHLRRLEEQLCRRLDSIDDALRALAARGPAEVVEEAFAGAAVESAACAPRGGCECCQSPLASPASTVRFEGPKAESLQEEQAAEAHQDAVCESFRLRPEWASWYTKETDQSTVVLMKSRSRLASFLSVKSKGEGHLVHDAPWFVILPNRPFRMCWDLIMGLLIAHDMAVMPINLAFETDDNVVTAALFWPFLIFWTTDLPLTFVTAVYRNGHVETRLKLIALTYLRSWFVLDLFVVGSTWLEVWAEFESDGYLLGRMGKTLRVLRVARTLRFLRVAKLHRIAREMSENFCNEYHTILFTVVRLILTIVWLNHFIACGWWTVGLNSCRAGFSDCWTSSFQNAKFDFQYFSALHWSLTQFTPAGMEVTARNTPERIFSVCVLLFAMITFSTFVSNITAAMTQLRQLRSRDADNYSLLRRFLRSRHLPLELTIRILHCVDYRLSQRTKEIQEGQVQYLKLLSAPLKIELSLHMSGPILARHPFLRRYAEIGLEAMRRVCLEATERSLLSTEDKLFCEGDPSSKVYFVIRGGLRYRQRSVGCVSRSATFASEDDDGASSSQNDAETLLEVGDMCCEVCMWCPWHHCGTMIAAHMSEVLALEVEHFQSITCQHNTVNRFSARYGKLYIDELLGQCPDGRGVTDLSILSHEKLEVVVERAFLKQQVQTRTSAANTMRAGMTLVKGSKDFLMGAGKSEGCVVRALGGTTSEMSDKSAMLASSEAEEGKSGGGGVATLEGVDEQEELEERMVEI